jgi:8-oxo-dGTP pyrophosphatase MutT (NUDIX family)
MSYLDRIAGAGDLSRYLPFRVDGTDVGSVKKEAVEILAEFTDVFRVSEAAVVLADGLSGFEQRTDAVDAVMRQLAARKVITGWRDEAYPVATSFPAPALFLLERAAVPLLGVRAYELHVNGYVKTGDSLSIWIGRRSLAKPTEPGKLDQLVAGGQPAGISVRDNLKKECAEEAGIPAELAAKAVPSGALSYAIETPEGLRRETLFNFDLEVPADFPPANTDGEVDEFYLWPMDRVKKTLRDGEDFKFNCALVGIDFLIRHGFIEADHPDYEGLLHGLYGLGWDSRHDSFGNLMLGC